MWIEKKFKTFLGKLSNSEKVAFIATFLGGLIGHLYIFANTIPNFDGISRVYDEQQMTLAGRWFLHYASGVNYFTQMPMVIGVLTMFFLGLAVMLVVHLLEIESSLLAGLWGILTAVFPAMADTITYTYTAAAYGIAFLLAVVGVWLVNKGIMGFITGTVCLALSMGIYQTYCTVAISLCVLVILNEALQKESKVKELLLLGLRHVLHLGLGAALYYGILKVFLKVKDLQLWSYLGMSDVEQGYPIGEIGLTLKKTYMQVGEFLLKGTDGLNHGLVLGAHYLLIVGGVLLFLVICREQKLLKNPAKLFGILVLFLVTPIAVNFTQIISPYSQPRLIMKMAFIFLYLVPVILWNKSKKDGIWKRAKETVAVVSVGSLLALNVYFWEYDNLMYTMLDQAHRATLSFVTNVVSRVESYEGYHRGMQIVVIGGFPADRYDNGIPVYNRVKHESALSSSVIPLNKHIYYYMRDWLNVPVREPPEEMCIDIANTDAFKQMPLYPADGSVREIGGCVVVKMGENVSLKSEFEKQYEKRR